jgi:uncharacterized protein (DUF302 family)
MVTDTSENGIKTLASSHAVGETLSRLENQARSRGMKIFARINFSQDAAAVGLSQLPTELLLLGSPKAGTPLMLAVPTIAIDLPLKVLAWQDQEGRCWVSYNSPDYLQRRHGIAPELIANIAGLGSLVEAAARP